MFQSTHEIVLPFRTVNTRRPMANPLALSVWLGIALYVTVGLFGVIIFHDAAPITHEATSGYGISNGNVPQPYPSIYD
jgi:hypothetical protein